MTTAPGSMTVLIMIMNMEKDIPVVNLDVEATVAINC